MITKRIIPCLDIRNGRTVKGVRFENLRDAGDPVELAVRYEEEGADELVFLDISATLEGREATVSLVSQIAKQLTIPFTIGGGIRSPEDASRLLNCGADKISLNSAAVENPDLITDMASAFGSQFVVVAIDYKFCPKGHQVATHGGTRLTPWLAMDWAKEVQDRGAGEILLTSMDHDGSNNGFDIEFLSSSSNTLTIPVIASGGAGRMNHFADLFQQTDVDAALAASVFHDAIFKIAQLKENLFIQNISVRL